MEPGAPTASASASPSGASASASTASAPAAAAHRTAPISDAYRPPASEQVHFRSALWSAIGASDPDLPAVRALIELGGQLTAPEWRVLVEHESVDGLRTALEQGLRPDVATMGELLRTAACFDEMGLPDERAAAAMCAVLVAAAEAAGEEYAAAVAQQAALSAVYCARNAFRVPLAAARDQWPEVVRVLVDWCRARGIAEDDIRRVERTAAGYADSGSDFAQGPQMDR